MGCINLLTINQEFREEDLVEVILSALRYFPNELWDGLNYIGNINIEYDFKINFRGEIYGAFLFKSLMENVRRFKKIFEIENILVALTCDPVVVSHYRFEKGNFKRINNLVRDYVCEDLGIISLFNVDEETSVRIAAHGLGHSQGLPHHSEPIDLMYVGLLNGSRLIEEGFCRECRVKLERKVTRI
ncbi:MAG: hypothetical protein QW638_06375 [Candidatus Bathyarchaeia archaeon]